MSSLRTDLDTDKRAEAMKALLVHWYETREDVRTLYYCMTSATSLKLPVTSTMARKLLESKNCPVSYKTNAMTRLAQSGDADAYNVLLPLLKDEAVASQGIGAANAKRSPIRVQDTALAMCLLLKKQNPADYGFAERYKANSNNAALKFNINNFYFDNTNDKADEIRKEAFMKWEQFLETDKKSEDLKNKPLDQPKPKK
jgi:hypothetical protein